MDHIGIDVHTKDSRICILAEGRERIEERICTEPERFAAVLGERPRARIVLEASTDSAWVARCLEGLGHEVIVADPICAAPGRHDVRLPMFATIRGRGHARSLRDWKSARDGPGVSQVRRVASNSARS